VIIFGVSAAVEPSYEELAALVAELGAALGQAHERIAELEARLGMNSRNSSKPPSAEGLAKPAPRSLRRRSGRRPGGQKGHPGSTLQMVARPDEVVVREPAACRGCGADLASCPRTGLERRQCFDVPPIMVKVTEHQLVERRCACGVRTAGTAPGGVDAPVQYGPRITAVILYLYVGQFLSKARTAQALAELFGTPVATGTVAALTARAAGSLEGFLELVRGQIAAAEAAHFDETGLRVAGRLHWVHSASTGRYSLITVHPKRGTNGMDAAGVLPAFTGIAHHDAWAPYDTYTGATHALCNAHVLRELQAVTDQTGDGPWCWAGQAADALREMHRLIAAALATGGTLADIEAPSLETAIYRWRSAALLGAAATAERSTKLMAKHHALARRLLDRQADYLRFTTDPRANFDNNAAEREIRMIKLRQKVSGCLRTLTGAQQFCAIRSYLATAAKHGKHFFESLVTLAEGHPWLPETA
jgi:transposase